MHSLKCVLLSSAGIFEINSEVSKSHVRMLLCEDLHITVIWEINATVLLML